ncbi:hypothetical protein [Nocardioides sp.]|uniref:hypothetical protein n=1 Tax=Nocardioides sp. TaxID=35761 RepID=UPI0039E439FB
MTWTTFHSRGEILRNVIDVADRRRDGLLPMSLDGVAEKFDGELDLLGALQLRWHTRLAGRVEQELAGQPLDLEAGVIDAWRAVAAEMPGVRATLDHYRAEPLDEEMARMLARAVAKEHILLAVMAGHAAVSDQLAVVVGSRIEQRARAPYRPVEVTPETSRPSLLGRLKAVLAA